MKNFAPELQNLLHHQNLSPKSVLTYFLHLLPFYSRQNVTEKETITHTTSFLVHMIYFLVQHCVCDSFGRTHDPSEAPHHAHYASLRAHHFLVAF